MRLFPWLLLAACKYDAPEGFVGDPDAPTPDGEAPYVLPDPELFPGGGVGDGPIVAGINVFAVDEDTDLPIVQATVTIGAVSGTTDDTGLFRTVDPSVAGKQSVLITAAGYRPQLWVGVEGTNVTIQLQPLATPPPAGQVAGNITGFGTLPFVGGSGHQKRATINYSQDDNASDAVNNIRSGSTNSCIVIPTGTSPADDCNYTVASRTGPVAMFAAINEYNTNNTGGTQDDSQTLITYAFKTGITLGNGVAMTGQALTVIPQTDLVDVTTDFGTPPPELTGVFGFVGIELPIEGFALLNFALPGVSTKLPKTSLFGGSSYRLAAVAQRPDRSAFSIPIRRGQTSTTLTVGTWLEPPTNIVATRELVSFTASTGNIHIVGISGDNSTDFLGVVILDGSSTVAVPTSIVLPTTPLSVFVEGVGSTIDVTDFGFDADRAKITDVAFRFVVI